MDKFDELSKTRKAVMPMFDTWLTKFVDLFEKRIKSDKSLVDIHIPDRVKVDNLPEVQAVDVKSFPHKDIQEVKGKVEITNQYKAPKVQEVKGKVVVENPIEFPKLQKVEDESSADRLDILADRIDKLSDLVSSIKIPGLPNKFPVEIKNWQHSFSEGGSIRISDGEHVADVTISGGLKVSLQEFNGAVVTGLPTKGAFQVNDVEEAGGSITYVGKEATDGTWWLVKIDESSSPITIQHASIATDAAQTTYTLAWTNRATLSYTDYAGAF